MNRSEPTWCRWSDAVLARHLDGELADDVADHPLDAHLQTCQRCQQALRRARRLDAVLAQDSGEFQHERLRTEALQALWFAAVASAAARAANDPAIAPPASAGALGHGPIRFVVALAAAAALVIGSLFFAISRSRGGDHSPTPSSGPWPTVEQPLANSTAEPPSPGAAASAPVDSRPPATTRAPVRVGEVASAEVASAEVDLRQLRHWPSSVPPREPAPRPHGLNRLGFADAGSARDWVARLHDRDTPVLEPSFLRRALACNDPAVDEALRRRMRRHADSLGLVALAARETPARGSTAELLLGLFEDATVRGSSADEGTLAQQLFAGQSAATFRALGLLANARGHVERQRRCWLALGWSHDLDPTHELLAVVHGQSRQLAVTAAFALSCQPWPRLLPLADASGQPNAYLVRAALWRNGAPELAQALAEWPVPAGLAERLHVCSFPIFSELVDGVRHGAGTFAE